MKQVTREELRRLLAFDAMWLDGFLTQFRTTFRLTVEAYTPGIQSAIDWDHDDDDEFSNFLNQHGDVWFGIPSSIPWDDDYEGFLETTFTLADIKPYAFYTGPFGEVVANVL